jgi:hypothetical protein
LGGLARLGPIALVAGDAIASLTAQNWLDSVAAKENAKGHTLLGGVLHFVGTEMSPVAEIIKQLSHHEGEASDKAGALGKSLTGVGISLSNAGVLGARAGGQFATLHTRLDELAHLKSMSADKVASDWIKAGQGAWYAGRQVQTLHTMIEELPNGKQVVITLPTLKEVQGELSALHSRLTAIAGTYGITFQIHTQGQPPIGRLAGGAVFRAASGFMFEAGEANYPTPMGAGAEVVSSAGVLPLDDRHWDRMGDRVAARIGASGGASSAKDIAAALWPLIREVANRPVIVQVNRREIARAVADQGVWDS